MKSTNLTFDEIDEFELQLVVEFAPRIAPASWVLQIAWDLTMAPMEGIEPHNDERVDKAVLRVPPIGARCSAEGVSESLHGKLVAEPWSVVWIALDRVQALAAGGLNRQQERDAHLCNAVAERTGSAQVGTCATTSARAGMILRGISNRVSAEAKGKQDERVLPCLSL